jgi:predicted GTPase
MVMSEKAQTFQSFLAQVKDAATVLEEQETINLIEAIKSQTSEAKLRLLIVGATGSGRFSIANVLLEQPDFLPTSSIPKLAISVSIGYGESVIAEVAAQNGVRIVKPLEELKPFLTSPDTDESKYQSIDVKTNCDLLKTCEINIENINAKRSDLEWKELLTRTDYVILVLKAVAVLSEPEKQFIKDIIKPNFALERVAILLNQIDLVPEDERASISEFVRSFLGPFESQPLLMEFSAKLASKSIGTDSIVTDRDYDRNYEALRNLVKYDLIRNLSLVKSQAMRQAAEICLNEVEEKATRQIALMTIQKTELEELSDKINSQNQWLESRIQKAQNKIELFINTLIKNKFSLEIEGFSLALQQQLPGEIMPIQDITKIRRYLPGYLEAVWIDFFKYQEEEIKTNLITEIQQISQTVQEDLQELLGNQAINFQPLLSSLDTTSANLKTFLISKRGKNRVNPIATVVQLGGLLILTTNVPLGIATFSSGQLIRMIGKEAIDKADKEAIISEANKAIQEQHNQVKQKLENQFDNLTIELKIGIADLYNEAIKNINEALQHAKTYSDKKEELEKLVRETIPEFRQIIRKIV